MWSLERIILALLSDTCDLSEVIFLFFPGVSEQGVHRVQVHLQFFGKEYKIFFEMLQLFDVYTSDTPELSRAKLKTFWAEPSQADQL